MGADECLLEALKIGSGDDACLKELGGVSERCAGGCFGVELGARHGLLR